MRVRSIVVICGVAALIACSATSGTVRLIFGYIGSGLLAIHATLWFHKVRQHRRIYHLTGASWKGWPMLRTDVWYLKNEVVETGEYLSGGTPVTKWVTVLKRCSFEQYWKERGWNVLESETVILELALDGSVKEFYPYLVFPYGVHHDWRMEYLEYQDGLWSVQLGNTHHEIHTRVRVGEGESKEDLYMRVLKIVKAYPCIVRGWERQFQEYSEGIFGTLERKSGLPKELQEMREVIKKGSWAIWDDFSFSPEKILKS